jgi:hypothetical protein
MVDKVELYEYISTYCSIGDNNHRATGLLVPSVTPETERNYFQFFFLFFCVF